MAARTLALLLLLGALRAEAHSNDAQIVFEGNRARLRMVIRSENLAQFDGNRDGLISAAEIDRNFAAMNQWLDARLPITDQQHRAPRVVFSDLVVPGESLNGSPTVTMVRTYEWKRTPDFAVLLMELEDTPHLHIFRLEPAANDPRH